ncbi:MAG TPA: lasso peptide biosynthesis B2 protein [Brevundimonas sp.]
MTINDPIWCAPGVFFAQVQDDIVVLDLNADQYHCLIDAAASIETADSGALRARDEATALELISAGLATSTPQDARRPHPPSARVELDNPTGAPSPAEILQAGAALFAAGLACRGKSILDLIAADVRRAARPDEAAAAEAGRIVAAARAALPWIPLEGECLQKSYQLRRLLRRHGVPVDWVFGVRTWPFGAHCWLQIGDRVVADRLERVRRYTPIMSAP